MITEFDRHRAIADQHIRRKETEIETEQKRTNLTPKQTIRIGKELEFIHAIKGMEQAWRKQIDMGFGKLPPQDIELEGAILGALMLESNPPTFEGKVIGKTAIEKVNTFLLPSHFYSQHHKIIYDTILKLHNEKITTDMRIVVTELRRNGKLNTLPEGAHYIAELTSKVSSAANIEYHARTLVEYAIKRELILLAGDILYKAYDEIEDIFLLLENTESQIEEIKKINIKK